MWRNWREFRFWFEKCHFFRLRRVKMKENSQLWCWKLKQWFWSSTVHSILRINSTLSKDSCFWYKFPRACEPPPAPVLGIPSPPELTKLAWHTSTKGGRIKDYKAWREQMKARIEETAKKYRFLWPEKASKLKDIQDRYSDEPFVWWRWFPHQLLFACWSTGAYY